MISISARFRQISCKRRGFKSAMPRRNRLVCIERPRLFEGLSVSECTEIVSFAQDKRFLPTQTIFGQDTVVPFISLLVRGRVKTMRLSRLGIQVIVRIEEPGDLVGGLGLPSEEFEAVKVQAIEPCQVLAWEAQIFDALCERFPTLRHNSAQILDQRLRMLEERFLELATENVTSRLARMLVRLLEPNGPARQVARIAFSNRELAQMTGMTPFTVNRLLSEWQRRGIIRKQHKAVSVLDLPGLTDLTGCNLMYSVGGH